MVDSFFMPNELDKKIYFEKKISFIFCVFNTGG